jgi:hypothetical protein
MKVRRFCRSATLPAAAWLALAPACAWGAFSVNRNGVVWDATFEGDVADLTASAPAWGVFDRNGFASETTDGNLYRYVSGSVGTSVSYEQLSTFAGGPDGAWTVEARLRVEPSTFEASDGAGGIVVGVNGVAYNVRFHSHTVTYNVNGSLNPVVPSIDPTQFRVYRMVVDQSASPAFSLYIDNDPVPAFTSNASWFISPGFNKIVFGDFSTGGLAGIVETDYVSWTRGAFPVPEPATGALALGLAAAALRRRRG